MSVIFGAKIRNLPFPFPFLVLLLRLFQPPLVEFYPVLRELFSRPVIVEKRFMTHKIQVLRITSSFSFFDLSLFACISASSVALRSFSNLAFLPA